KPGRSSVQGGARNPRGLTAQAGRERGCSGTGDAVGRCRCAGDRCADQGSGGYAAGRKRSADRSGSGPAGGGAGKRRGTR
ncbi:hypothetical protein, partial [Paenibacillus sp. tmac-D7]|uniref:hypothetical protein n=1 Tax=Paenibacillus sp. tmac-D7 TaxID=2591462 RepID=UPI00358F8CE4